MVSYTFVADGDYRINQTPGQSSEDGLVLSFGITGTTSGVLAVNTAPPGSAVSLSNIAYLNASLASQSAGTAITASGLAYVSATDAARGDLYLVLNWTSGETVVRVGPSSLGNAGGAGGSVPAADVTAGTFGANSGSVGDYAFPDDVTVTDLLTAADITITDDLIVGDDADVVGDLTAGTIASDAGLAGLQLTVTGGASNAVAATIAGGSVTAANTTRTVNVTQTWNTSGVVDGALRVAITDTASGANSLAVNVLGGASATTTLFSVDKDGDGILAGNLSTGGTSASLAQNAATATTNVGTGTGSGASSTQVRSAAGQTAGLALLTGATTARWNLYKNNTAESGANAGSNLNLEAYDDAGASIDTPLTIARAAAGAATWSRPLRGSAGALFTSPTLGIGYATGAGGAQTQATNKQTTVVSNTITTAITMNNEQLNLLTITAFTFTNSCIAATDTVLCTHESAGTSGAYTVNAFPGAGSAVISVRNNTAGNLSEAIVIRVTVIKSVSA